MRTLAALVPLLLLGAAAPASGRDPLPVGTNVDYQLGGVRPVPSHVGIVARDRGAPPIPRRYNVCYVNAFQAQDTAGTGFPSAALLRTSGGSIVIDPDWDEAILDTRTAASRAAITSVIYPYLDECASKGFRAVELDNLDTFTRFSQLTQASNLALADALVAYGRAKLAMEGHARALAAATGVRVVLGRLANVYGPGQTLGKPQGLLSQLCLADATRRPLPVYVSLDTIRDYLYAGDAARMVADTVVITMARSGSMPTTSHRV